MSWNHKIISTHNNLGFVSLSTDAFTRIFAAQENDFNLQKLKGDTVCIFWHISTGFISVSLFSYDAMWRKNDKRV